jgi:hypothetical protein
MYSTGDIMNVMGIEFAGSKMHCVVVALADDGTLKVVRTSRLVLSDTREREALNAFQTAVKAAFQASEINLIGIKDKPEKGAMSAGAAALKMEGIVLANATCPVDFVSGKRINDCKTEDKTLHAYYEPALKAASAAMAKRLK